MNSFEALECAREEFDRRLRLVGTDDWNRATPCSEWSVRDLANHVVGGCLRYTMLLHGANPDRTNATRALDHLGADPVGSFVVVADEMDAAFREPGALTRIVHHPAGDCSGQVLIEMRVLDWAIHGWDLARALASDEALDPDLVELLWDIASATVPDLRPFYKMADGSLPADVALQSRLLHLTGRRP